MTEKDYMTEEQKTLQLIEDLMQEVNNMGGDDNLMRYAENFLAEKGWFKESDNDNSQCSFDFIEQNPYAKIKKLQEQIEKMKCCNNCEHRYFMGFKGVCAFDKSDIKNVENPYFDKCEKWEIEK